MKQFIAGANEEGVRLSRFVQNVTTQLPPSLLYKSFRNKRIKVNGKKAAPETRLLQGDVIELYINDEFFVTKAQKPVSSKKSKYKLNVIYENEMVAFLYKPAHLLCHSDRTGDISLIELFQAYLQEKEEYNPTQEVAFKPAICNRLDRGTEGIVIAAKTYAALRDMNMVIKEGKVHKQYFCITFGKPPQGRHIAYLQHKEKNNKVTICKVAKEGYKQIITEVSVIRTDGPFSLCSVQLITGRTHQIRAHLAFLDAPVLGDIKYGNQTINQKLQFKTQALCAYSLRFDHSLPESLVALQNKEISLPQSDILIQYEQLSEKEKLKR